MKKKEKLN